MRRQKRKMTSSTGCCLSLTACSGKPRRLRFSQSESTTEAEFPGIIDVKTGLKATFEAITDERARGKPDHYEELGSGIYQVYVEKMEKSFPTPSSIPLPASTTDKK